jgi:hypothetical protein
MCQAFGQDAFPVDTHIHRLAQRWGLTDGANVEATEADLKALFPQRLWKELHLQIIFLGREHCPAQRHDPAACPLCKWAAVPPYNKPGASPYRPGESPPKAPKAGAAAGGQPKNIAAALEAEAGGPRAGKRPAPPPEAGAFGRGRKRAAQSAD